jgi:hypothetical protein
MTIDLAAAERFVLANARLLERHRFAALVHGAPTAPVLAALAAYRNADGGFGHALEPDVRGPHSEPASTLHALEVLAEVRALDEPMVASAAAFAAANAGPDGGLPFVAPGAAAYPHAPWMVPGEGGSFLTLGIAAVLLEAGLSDPWMERATAWGWASVEAPESLSAHWVKFALDFLDAVPDGRRAQEAIERLRSSLSADGSMPVAGGTRDERLTPLTLAPRPHGRSRRLFTERQIDDDLDRLEAGQQDDGGWTFDFLAWSPGQEVEWRGIVTLRALAALVAHGRVATAM